MQRTITIAFEAKINANFKNHPCEGCIGHNSEICVELPNCADYANGGNDVIFVAVAKE